MKLVLESSPYSFNGVCLWTDSKIVLGWINGNPDRYKKFIASRIRKINKLSDKRNWYHVEGINNSADCASRGLLPSQLSAHELWWNGPSFLHDENFSPNKQNFKTDHEREITITNANTNVSILSDITSFHGLKKTMAYALRFIWNCKNRNNKRIGVLTMDEIDQAQTVILKSIQFEFFNDEISLLSKDKPLPKTNRLVALSPFIDENGLLRVGGRLSRADLPFDARHQILLPKKHPITDSIIKEKHEACNHGGPKLTESVFRQRYWITDSQRSIKSVVRKCINCFKTNPKPMHQYMADLPANRVNVPRKPFFNTALDYTGCIFIKMANGRGHRTTKAYISIFVCMATKAMHLEVVSELTAAAFIAAFRRFVVRRGAMRHLHSDNGTNFVSSNKILMENAELEAEEYHKVICNELIKNETRWHFSPPGAPHFNGLAEAAVKTVKLHLIKTIGDTKLTFEEMATLLAQIEACVNSRPLCPLSSSPDDIGVLTPGHFLVGEPLVSPPEQNHLESNINWLTRAHQASVSTPFEVTKFDSSPGLYFEKMSDVYIVGATWNVLAYLNLETLNKEYFSIQLNFSTAKSICLNKLAERTGCRIIISHLSARE